jgi:hypothetical protein
MVKSSVPDPDSDPCKSSVPDPDSDPYVFGKSGSINQRYGSASFHH